MPVPITKRRSVGTYRRSNKKAPSAVALRRTSWTDRSFVVGSAASAASAPDRGRRPRRRPIPHAPITIINPFPPGGAADVVRRPLAAVLEPHPQAAGGDRHQGRARPARLGAQVAAAAKPDGYTLLAHITSISGFSEVDKLFGRTPKFTRADFIPIARFVADPCVLIVNDQQPYKTLKEFIDDAKKRPDEIIFSSSGLYGALHIPMALYHEGGRRPEDASPADQWRRPGADRGARQQLAGAGLVGVGVPVADQGRQGAAARSVRRAARSKALPDVPTMKELGYDIEYYLWVGVFGAEGHAATPSSTRCARPSSKAAHTDQFKTATHQPRPGARLSRSAGRSQKFLGGRRQAHRGRRRSIGRVD